MSESNRSSNEEVSVTLTGAEFQELMSKEQKLRAEIAEGDRINGEAVNIRTELDDCRGAAVSIRPIDARDEVTRYGFTWGPMDVMRACADGRYRSLLIRTPYAELQVHVSPTGRSIRTYKQRTRKERK